jgi:hypothetical protein
MKRPKFIPLRDPAEVPELKTEAEARAFWDTHEVTAEYLERAGPVPDSELPPVRESSRLISLRLSRDLEARLKALARRKGKAYQTLLKEFVLERLYEEEKREGLR